MDLTSAFEKLPNGAYVVARKPSTKYPGNHVVICINQLSTARIEWVTWLMKDDDRSCFWGHYFPPEMDNNLQRAVEDFKERS